ncbi:hypothetical protein [Streptomyces sp. NBC_01500]|uniref:hypothetical protein n=1 Tax=Streptomyces sp. NBC_01500 TaxID=2903886 RepID=UPI0022588FEE|nr:hypothetical protein [Streptomyces sp. NBC_01500]MCX4554290.1 hypothetical protein [Streptomyces sp. NBC_01500]
MGQRVLTGIAGTRLAPAGLEWDTIKVSHYYALQALERLVRPGSVAVDPAPAEPALYFFVPPGTTKEWDVAHSTALGIATHVVLPPNDKTLPPGPYWLITPRNGRLQHTQAAALRLALEAESQPIPERAS